MCQDGKWTDNVNIFYSQWPLSQLWISNVTSSSGILLKLLVWFWAFKYLLTEYFGAACSFIGKNIIC